jgi:hypothetical protein
VLDRPLLHLPTTNQPRRSAAAPTPQTRVAPLTRALLASRLDADSCWAINHILRHPGTINDKSGRPAEIVEFSSVILPIEKLDLLGPMPAAVQRGGISWVPRRDEEDEEWLPAAEELAGWQEREISLDGLMVRHHLYMNRQPARGWSAWGYPSRSEIEYDIAYRLVGKMAGASDQQIIELADRGFAKHIEDYPKHGNDYIDRTIRAARRQLYAEGWVRRSKELLNLRPPNRVLPALGLHVGQIKAPARPHESPRLRLRHRSGRGAGWRPRANRRTP